MKYKWINPKDADIPGGEVCLALYKEMSLPFLVYKNFSYNIYHPLPPSGKHDLERQPDYVLQIPPIPKK